MNFSRNCLDLKDKKTKEIWPNFFIVGAPRAGTSSLYEYLLRTPGVYMSRIKEINYFCPNSIPDNFPIPPIRNRKKYLELFRNVNDEKAIGDSSPSYLRDPETPQLIHKIIPNAQIIISLRNPVEQIFSNHLMNTSLGWDNFSLRERIQENLSRKKLQGYIDIVPAAVYSESVKRYLDTFGSNQVKIIIFEEFVKDTIGKLKEVLKFLNVNSNVPEITEKTFNPYSKPRGRIAQSVITSGTVRKISNRIISPSLRVKVKENILLKKTKKPKLSKEDKKFLQQLFHDDIKKLEKIMCRALPWKD